MSVVSPLFGDIQGTLGEQFKFRTNIQAIAAEYVIAATAPRLQFLHPSTAVDVLLPAEDTGLFFIIVNDANDASTLTVKDDGDSVTVATVAQNEMCIVVSDGTGWNSLVGTNT